VVRPAPQPEGPDRLRCCGGRGDRGHRGAGDVLAAGPGRISRRAARTPCQPVSAVLDRTDVACVDPACRLDSADRCARHRGADRRDEAKNGVIDPPTHDAAYWLSDYGAPSAKATNTVYLVGHSWSKGPAVFNSFTDAASQQSKIPVGTTIVVVAGSGPLTYVVDATATYAKSQLTTTKDVWSIVPGRLVLITCFLHEGVDRSPDNFVVFAHLVTPAG